MKVAKLIFLFLISLLISNCSSSESTAEGANPCGNVSSFSVSQNRANIDFTITTDKPGPYEISVINLQGGTPNPEYGTKFITGDKVFSKSIGNDLSLSPNGYSFFVRNICSSSSKSDWGLEKTISVNHNFCATPKNISVTDYINNTISWDINTSYGVVPSSCQVQYGPQGFTPVNSGTLPSGVIMAESANESLNATMLVNTRYDIYVRSYCSASNVGNWVGPVSYLCVNSTNQCVAPSYANFTIETQSTYYFSPRVTWENDYLSQYEYALTTSTAIPSQGQLSSIQGPYNLVFTNLSKSTNYYFFIRKVCSSNVRTAFFGPYSISY